MRTQRYDALETPDADLEEVPKAADALGRRASVVYPKFAAVPLDEDCYGAAMFSTIFDIFEISTGVDHDGLSIKLNMFRVVFVNIILISNYVLQVAMLWFIWSYVTRPSVHKVQSLYKKFHEEVFVDGAFDSDRFDSWPDQDKICEVAFSNFFFMYAILCLWWCTILKDVRVIERLFRTVKAIPHTLNPFEMIQLPDEDQGESMVKVQMLTPLVRGLVYGVIILPKLGISILLLLIGTVWLSATDSYADLILNAVALEFVINIDELLFQAMMPSSI
ncbi:unnamed protein product, partial [Polarella glacialis]